MGIKIIDTTIRDGSNAVDFQYTEKILRTILQGLKEGGVQWIDLGHGWGVGACERSGKKGILSDDEYISVAEEILTDVHFGMFFLSKFGTKNDIDILSRSGADFIRIGSNITETAGIESYVKYAKEKGLFTNICLMKAYALDLEEYISIIEQISRWSPDLITLMDSAGTMMPCEVKEKIAHGRLCTDVELGFHAHNNLQLGVWNAITALESGASSIDVSVGGMGRSSGNAPAEIIALVLSKMGYSTGLDYKKLSDLNDSVIYPLIGNENRFSTEAITFGYAGFHSSFYPLVKDVAANYPDIDIRDLVIKVSEKEKINLTKDLIANEAKKLISIQKGV